jgi:hypothetical protein
VGAEPATKLAMAGGISEGREKAQGIGVHLTRMEE